MGSYLREIAGRVYVRFVKALFVLGRVIEVTLVGAAIFVWLFYVGGFPTYKTATISLEHWPRAFLGGIVIMVLLGFVLRRVDARYHKPALYVGIAVCMAMLEKALIDDVGEALVLYGDFHTSSVTSGWEALIAVVAISMLYCFWLYKKARKISRF